MIEYFYKKRGENMKKIFVVICNPKEKSQKEIYVQTYIDEAKKCGHEVRVLNLYDLKIDYLKFNGDEPDTALTDELKQAQDNIVWSDQFVIVYPLWCFAIPAILKAFIERTFINGALWKFGKMGPEPVLKNKTAVIIQSYAMPYFFMKLQGDLPMKYWKILLHKWCGFKIVKRFDLDMISTESDKKRQKWINSIKKFVSEL